MYNGLRSSGLVGGADGQQAPSAPVCDLPLAPLMRLRQLALELRAASARNDMEVVHLAAILLGPALERCLELRDQAAWRTDEAATIALETHDLLRDCEFELSTAMRGIAAEMKRVQQGKRAVLQIRARTAHRTIPKQLDTSR